MSIEATEGFGDATGFESKVIEGIRGAPAAVVWLLHHGYYGSIPSSQGVSGFRARQGNIQVGSPRIFAEEFEQNPHSRRNSTFWSKALSRDRRRRL
jgi:hypothetical protein